MLVCWLYLIKWIDIYFFKPRHWRICWKKFFAREEVVEIKNAINKTEIKNLLSNTYKNVPKFNLKVYAYVYDELICFPRSDIEFETITTNKFFTNAHRLIIGKFHLHYSHITGEIFGYMVIWF